MEQKKAWLEFGNNVFWQEGQSGTGEYMARMLVVHEGRENEAADLKKAFGSASGHGVKVRDGVKAFTVTQMEKLLDTLEGIENPTKEQKRSIEELGSGLAAVARHVEVAPNGPAAGAPTSVHRSQSRLTS